MYVAQDQESYLLYSIVPVAQTVNATGQRTIPTARYYSYLSRGIKHRTKNHNWNVAYVALGKK
jgi:hypothetical protein